MLKDLEKQLIWKYFFEISRIPRPSGHEEKIIQYLVDFAERRKLKYKKDKAGNIVIFKNASKGKEKSPAVVLQSHIDMVCEKNEGTKHDFLKDPLELYEDKGFIKAKGTTLGADDGIGVAASLAVLDSKDISHGPVECLFTVDEETGLTGANALTPGFVTGKFLLNLDTEEEGSIFIGCAGGMTTSLSKKNVKRKKNDKKISCRITVEGLKGGHSGIAISRGHANALLILARFLWDINKSVSFDMVGFNGGEKHNAIPREANAVVTLNEKDLKTVEKETVRCSAVYLNEYKNIEERIQIRYEKIKSSEDAFADEEKNNLLNMIHSFPHGVHSMSGEIKGLVQTSTNLAAVKTERNEIFILTSQRSSVESSIHDISGKVAAHALLAGFEYKCKDPYPAWTPDPKSKLLKTAVDVHKELFSKKPKILAVHAGLECGIIGKKYPGMDMISIGPDVFGAHSPDERVSIRSVGNFWNYLKNLIEKI
ncbi:MAG TPA: aminoacyl-histidine dipeptidase [Clostridiales bacterium]|nr:aminoacyl-histidine dipeptidase [Clostridiales bacterium]HQP68783.1 aminoacyl-histidine dipeptidase [Clostridiales bacterium]